MADRGSGGHTLGCVGTQAKPESIGPTLGNPRWEVCLLRGGSRGRRPEPSIRFHPYASPGPTLCTCPSLAFSTSLGSRLLFSSCSWRP